MNWAKVGKILSIISWLIAWTIFSIKLDFWTYMGLVFYGAGLSGIIIFCFIKEEVK